MPEDRAAPSPEARMATQQLEKRFRQLVAEWKRDVEKPPVRPILPENLVGTRPLPPSYKENIATPGEARP
jgi:hypothetical protein